MAEFKEVLRQAKRMCDEFGDKCGICPIKDNCIMEATIESIDVEDFELKTMQWASEHPEITNKDVLLEMFPNAKLDGGGIPTSCPACIGNIVVHNCLGKDACVKCTNQFWLSPYEGKQHE